MEPAARTSEEMWAWTAETPANSAHTSSTDVMPRSTPRRSARSTAIIQSGRDVPGEVTFRTTRLTRPSRLVNVPSTSVGPAAGSTTSARATVAVAKRSTATTVPAPSSALRARSLSGTSASTSAPSRTSTSTSPSAAACRVARVSRPRSAGTPGQACTNRSAAASVARPGSRPGARPMSMAPCTLPLRSSERKRASGRWSWRARAASTTGPAASASEGRPSSTVTGPVAAVSIAPAVASASADLPPRADGDPVPNMAATTSAAPPGSTRSEWAAWSVSPVRRGVSSIRVASSWTTAWRRRR